MLLIVCIVVGVLIFAGAIIGGVGLLGDTKSNNRDRRGGGNNFIDWMF